MSSSDSPRFYASRIAVFTVSWFVASSAAAQSGWESFESCESIRASFRAFHGDAFPEGKWVCEGGELHSVKGQHVDLITRAEYEDFELELEWKVTYGANSGIMYGVSEKGTETF